MPTFSLSGWILRCYIFADVLLPKLGNFDVRQRNKTDFSLVHTFLLPTKGFLLTSPNIISTPDDTPLAPSDFNPRSFIGLTRLGNGWILCWKYFVDVLVPNNPGYGYSNWAIKSLTGLVSIFLLDFGTAHCKYFVALLVSIARSVTSCIMYWSW